MVHFSSAVVIAAMALSVTPTLAVPVVRHNKECNELQSSRLVTRSPYVTEWLDACAAAYEARTSESKKSGPSSRSKAKVADLSKENDPLKDKEGAESGPESKKNRRDIKDDYLLERDIDEYE